MAILDTPVVNLALHAIRGDLRVSVSVLQWVLDIYNLFYASFILTGGVLGDLFGRRRIFIAGISLFTAGSLVCGLAPNAAVLIFGRAIAGLGAALQLPGALSILTVTFLDPRERAQAIAIWADLTGWRWDRRWVDCWWITSAGGAFSTWWCRSRVGIVESRRARDRYPGTAIFNPRPGVVGIRIYSGSVARLVISADHRLPGGVSRKRRDAAEGRGYKPRSALSLSVFRNPAFAAAILNAAMMTFGFYTMLFIFPLYLQSVRHNSALVAGLE
jgi:DHA2 family methylenomycin A resistance protein-like MFS transporter